MAWGPGELRSASVAANAIGLRRSRRLLFRADFLAAWTEQREFTGHGWDRLGSLGMSMVFSTERKVIRS